MSFFWSGRNASISGIFARSARYWFTSFVGNCLWGPPGWRRGSWRYKAMHGEYKGSYPEIARKIAYDAAYEGSIYGWSYEKAERVARRRFKTVMGISVEEGDRLLNRENGLVSPEEEAATVAKAQEVKRAPVSVTRPAAIDHSGGVRGGASWQSEHRQRVTPPAVRHSGGLRGGAAKRWVR